MTNAAIAAVQAAAIVAASVDPAAVTAAGSAAVAAVVIAAASVAALAQVAVGAAAIAAAKVAAGVLVLVPAAKAARHSAPGHRAKAAMTVRARHARPVTAAVPHPARRADHG